MSNLSATIQDDLNLLPSNTEPSLTPLQLALMNFMATCNQLAISVNEDWLAEMRRLSDTKPLTPLDYDQTTGLPKKPDIATGITGINYIMIGEDVYVQRVAQDCGPNEAVRYENVLIGKRFQVAEGTFAQYGKYIYSGRVSNGTAYWTPDGPGTGA